MSERTVCAVTLKSSLVRVRDRRLNHFVEVIPEVLKSECDGVLDAYLDSPSNLTSG